MVLTAGGLGCAALIMTGPQTCLAAIGALTITGFLPVIAQSGDVDVNLADVFYVGAVAWWLVGVVERAGRSVPEQRPRIAFGQAVAIAFLAYAGLTLVTVASSDSGAVGSALVSWLRLVQTASLAWLAASLIESKRDIHLVLGAIAAAGVIAVADGALSGGGLLTERSGGSLGPNTLGLVSGLLLLFAAFGGVTSKAPYRIALAATGLLGLLLTKSVASLVATGFVLALGASLGEQVLRCRATPCHARGARAWLWPGFWSSAWSSSCGPRRPRPRSRSGAAPPPSGSSWGRRGSRYSSATPSSGPAGGKAARRR